MHTLKGWGYEPVAVDNGRDAWSILRGPDAPRLALLDWKMPKMDGTEVVRRIRDEPSLSQPYLVLLTGMSQKEDLVQGLDSGADDYVVKPFDNDELQARLKVGCRVLKLQSELADKVRELENALNHIKTLRGIIPICAYCKNIRNDQGAWEQVERYVREHSAAEFSHGVCPVCMEKLLETLPPDETRSLETQMSS